MHMCMYSLQLQYIMRANTVCRLQVWRWDCKDELFVPTGFDEAEVGLRTTLLKQAQLSVRGLCRFRSLLASICFF